MAYVSSHSIPYYGVALCPSCRQCFLGRDYAGERLCIRCGVSHPTSY